MTNATPTIDVILFSGLYPKRPIDLLSVAVELATRALGGYAEAAPSEPTRRAVVDLGLLLITAMLDTFPIRIAMNGDELTGRLLTPEGDLHPIAIRDEVPLYLYVEGTRGGADRLDEALFDDGKRPAPGVHLTRERFVRIHLGLLNHVEEWCAGLIESEDYNWGPIDDEDEVGWEDWPNHEHPEARLEEIRKLREWARRLAFIPATA